MLAIVAVAYGRSYYFCDFEDEAENAQWQLNTPKNDRFRWEDLWSIGGATACDGQRSMYISTDEGMSVGYVKASYILTAYREFTDLEAGDYNLAFDWRNVGDSLRAGMLVAWVPESQWEEMRCGQNDDLTGRDWILDNLVHFEQGEVLHNSSVWSHSVGEIEVDGTPHRLVFIFRQSMAASVRLPGPCVDNVQMARNDCGKPTDLQVSVNGAYATLTWQSTAEAFNLRYARQGSTDVTTLSNVKANKVVLPLEHGVYNVYIQVICNGETSVWYSFPVVLVYDSKCFNYLDLKKDQCYYAEETEANWQDNETTLLPGRIDYGFMSDASRHTIHYMEGEYDARTYNSYDSKGRPVSPLRTIPEGEIASVRIGSWEETAHVVRVVYDFTVDVEEASVLMLKYALVLQSSGHAEKDRPRFTLNIVDGDTGKELSKCTTVDFAAQTTGDGWYRSPAKETFSETDARDVCWRDWTTVGLNLEDFDGKNVRIILTVYGCTAEVHYGYAYFTLNCTAGNIEGINCGDTPTNEFVAPEGFNYRWYLASNPGETLSTERVFPVNFDDDREYMVDVIYKTNDQCRFTLTACAIPRYPVPEATYEVYQENCRNYIRFTNKSHVRTKNLKTGEIIEYSKYPLDFVVWDYGDLATSATEWEETIEAPAEGGHFTVSLRASVGLCEETTTMEIDLPAIGADSIVEEHTLCEGERYSYQGKTYYADTTVVFEGVNRYGCDSTFYLDLHFLPIARTQLSDTILEGTSYVWEVEGQSPMTLTEGGTYTKTIAQQNGCDSVLTLTLFVLPRLAVELLSVETVCEGQTAFDVVYRTDNGTVERVEAMLVEQPLQVVDWDDTYVRLFLPAETAPGYYPLSIRCYNEALGDCEMTAELELRYRATLIQQRWNDVLGILNEDYNGGYVFTAYQWYKADTPVADAVYPYYYEEGGLDGDAAYSVSLLREGDTRPIRTCDYRPVTFTPAQEGAEAPRKYLQGGHLYISVDGRVYDATGIHR